MRYMLMMHAPCEARNAQDSGWSTEDARAHGAFMYSLDRELEEAGERVDGQGLAPPAQAKLVHAGPGGMPVTDGPFPEAKEFLAGYWILDVDSPERAYEIAARASAAPGPGGVPLNLPIEVRRVMTTCPQDV
jgi:hypothetical protein